MEIFHLLTLSRWMNPQIFYQIAITTHFLFPSTLSNKDSPGEALSGEFINLVHVCPARWWTTLSAEIENNHD